MTYALHPEAFTRRVDAAVSFVAPRTPAAQVTDSADRARSALPSPTGGPSTSPTAPAPDASTTGAPANGASANASLPLGAAMLAKVPATSRQVLVVEGAGPSSSKATVRYYERRDGWVQVASWKGHVGKSGWASKHREGDLKTPVGVFGLTDAGGRLADPGTKLSYDRSSAFRAPDAGPAFGDSAADSFDYVIAINYNRVKGRSPLDWERPAGVARGGGIWLHVDHDGPTHGCVTIPKSALRYLLGRLQPSQKPVVVMGPAQSL
ncbi:L,D-peptidoglycan transpeptidase YkuD, ErfK/YbiS/YcfS/YnhG family [Pedococcus dokdonensis]|uniref:L,D-peptidoglycan transpeptidase YkuD, ErfK/YbiS/YcfS/YnhG family n=1 Tax=Pedococcus dokdonensis TaxID=443156 RepID=A0A1H0SEQ6_9MICO|nr:L,D-peptidoglycan transpeptidase YkuD, ErfK/YbiS/YcfS/YnhG family [Pedococcus dokdonensis]